MTQTGKPFLVAVVGCTAGGKTALALELARRHGGEIVSCDSMQIYRGMDIGTAKPDEAERAGIPHWLLDVADPTDPRGYSCADYVRDARAAVANILARGKLPILCGGTGLYLDAFLRGGTFEVTDTDQALRASLAAYAAQNGAEALHRELEAVDPESAAAIHPNNVKRVIRAREIYRTTGRRKSELDRASRTEDCPYRALVIGLRYSDRRILWDRIDRRERPVADLPAQRAGRRAGTAGVQLAGYAGRLCRRAADVGSDGAGHRVRLSHPDGGAGQSAVSHNGGGRDRRVHPQREPGGVPPGVRAGGAERVCHRDDVRAGAGGAGG